MKQKIIIFGGSFDPIHNGHLAVARFAVEHFKADELIFVPAKRSPHKQASPLASGDDRFEMIQLAIEGAAGLTVSDIELSRPEPSFTIDTISHFKNIYGSEAFLYLLIGADGLKELGRWYRINDILRWCNVCLMYRPGFVLEDIDRLAGVFGQENVQRLKENVLPNPQVDVSSTNIRNRLACDESIEGLVPEKVAQYIKARGLYAR